MKIFNLILMCLIFNRGKAADEQDKTSSNDSNLANIVSYSLIPAAGLALYKLILPRTLIWAVRNEYQELALKIISLKPNFDIQDENENTVFDYAFELNLLLVIDELISLTPEDELLTRYSKPLFFWAAKNNRLSYIRKLITKKTDLNIRDIHGMTPLLHAAKKNNFTVVKILLNHQADPNIQAKNGTTALIEAVKNNGFECVAHLLLYDAMINLKDKSGHVAVDYAQAKSPIKDVLSSIDPIEHYHIKNYFQKC
jgi:ankyrin repeat protein